MKNPSYPSTIKVYGGKRYYLLTKIITKSKAESIASSYRNTTGEGGKYGKARIVKVKGGYSVYVRT